MKTQTFLTIAILLVATTAFSKKNSTPSELDLPTETDTEIITYQESQIEIEEWMIDETVWNNALIQEKQEQTKKETTKILEDKNGDFVYTIKTSKEPEIKLEAWMTSKTYWKL